MIKIVTPDNREYGDTHIIVNIIRMRDEQIKLRGRCGPFIVYFSRAWDKHLDKPYAGGIEQLQSRSIYERVLQIEGIKEAIIVDWLAGWKMLLTETLVEGV